MLPAFALLAVRANLADTFIAECGKAVRSIKEGRLGFEIKSEGHVETTSFLVKNDASVMRVSVDGKPYCDILSTPTHFLAVQYANHQYAESTFPAGPMKRDEPLAPLEEGKFDFTMSPDRGFVLRSNPDLTGAKVSTLGPLETLAASAKAGPKERLDIALTRNAKTKLPTSLVLKAHDTVGESFRFFCEPRPVADAELNVEPVGYAGFTKVDSISDSSGTL